MKLIREFDDFDWARGPANLYVGQCIKDMMDPSNTEWVVEKIGTTFGDREVVYVSDGEETIMLDRKIAEEDLNNGRYVSCDNNFITESDDEWDWARGSVINPWLEYDGIIFDIEPRRDEVNRYIEMALKTIDDIVNKDQWRIGRENDINSIINYQKKHNHCILGVDNTSSLAYSYDGGYFSNGRLIYYSQLIGMEPLMESEDFKWIQNSNPIGIGSCIEMYRGGALFSLPQKEQYTIEGFKNIKGTDYVVLCEKGMTCGEDVPFRTWNKAIVVNGLMDGTITYCKEK